MLMSRKIYTYYNTTNLELYFEYVGLLLCGGSGRIGAVVGFCGERAVCMASKRQSVKHAFFQVDCTCWPVFRTVTQ